MAFSRIVFVDSNVFVDSYFDRRDNTAPLGEFAFQFIKATIECRFAILVLREVLVELEYVLKLNEEQLWERILNPLKEANKLEIIFSSKEQKKKAIELAKEKNIPKTDALIAVMAIENNKAVVSRDKHLEELRGLIEVFRPEEILSM